MIAVPDRGQTRHDLAAMLRAHVSLATAVYDEEPGDLGAKSPILVVESRASGMSPLTLKAGQFVFKYFIRVYTLAAKNATGTYTYADSANKVDALEAQIRSAILTNPLRWDACRYDGDSSIALGIFNSDGLWRYREEIPIAITLFC